MHRTHKALPNYRVIATEGSYRSIIGQSVIFCTPQMYLGSCIGCFLAKYNLISAAVAPKKSWTMVLVLDNPAVKHKVSLRFVARLPVFEESNKAFSSLRR